MAKISVVNFLLFIIHVVLFISKCGGENRPRFGVARVLSDLPMPQLKQSLCRHFAVQVLKI